MPSHATPTPSSPRLSSGTVRASAHEGSMAVVSEFDTRALHSHCDTPGVRLGSVLTDLVPIEGAAWVCVLPSSCRSRSRCSPCPPRAELQAVMDEYDDAYHRESGFALQQKLGLQDWNEEDFELVHMPRLRGQTQVLCWCWYCAHSTLARACTHGPNALLLR